MERYGLAAMLVEKREKRRNKRKIRGCSVQPRLLNVVAEADGLGSRAVSLSLCCHLQRVDHACRPPLLLLTLRSTQFLIMETLHTCKTSMCKCRTTNCEMFVSIPPVTTRSLAFRKGYIPRREQQTRVSFETDL